jgi:hypothetical protein
MAGRPAQKSWCWGERFLHPRDLLLMTLVEDL